MRLACNALCLPSSCARNSAPIRDGNLHGSQCHQSPVKETSLRAQSRSFCGLQDLKNRDAQHSGLETNKKNRTGTTRKRSLTAPVPVVVGEQAVNVGERREVGGVESHFSDSKRGDPSSTYLQSHPRMMTTRKTVLVAHFLSTRHT